MDTTTKRNINLERRAQIGQEKRARTRSQVLDAAFELLGREHGLTTRIEEICAAAGISRGTFYNYFGGMTELFAALSYEINHDFNAAVTEVMNAMPLAAERVGAAIRYYVERALYDPKWAWAMVNISAGGPIFGAETFEAAQKTAEEGIAAGEFVLTSPQSGRDVQLGIGLAAIITQLRAPPTSDYAATAAGHVLRAMGVAEKRINEIVARPLPDPFAVGRGGGSEPTTQRSTP